MSVTTESIEGRRIERADIEAKLREIRGEVDEVGHRSMGYAVGAGVVVVLAVVGLTFAWGKRKGKRRTTVVEVHRL